jgi:hypothetical protein
MQGYHGQGSCLRQAAKPSPINGTQSQFSCKKTIPLDMWNVKGNCYTEKCALGYTLLWNLFVALGTKIYTDYCHIKRKTTLFLKLCSRIITSSIFLLYLRTERSMLDKNN